MIEIVMTVCSLLAGQKCEERALQFADVTMFQCIMFAQQPIAEWAIGHPNWQITRYRCQPAGQYAKM